MNTPHIIFPMEFFKDLNKGFSSSSKECVAGSKQAFQKRSGYSYHQILRDIVKLQ